MFIVMTARVLLTPSGVKCSDVLRHMELLTEFAPRRLDCYKHGPPDGGERSKLPSLCGTEMADCYKSHSKLHSGQRVLCPSA